VLALQARALLANNKKNETVGKWLQTTDASTHKRTRMASFWEEQKDEHKLAPWTVYAPP